MADKSYVTLGFADNFLREYENKKIEIDTLYQALVNSLRYSEDLNEPLRGFKDNLQWFRETAEEQFEKAMVVFCRKFCEKNLDIDIKPEELRKKIQEFLIIANILGEILKQYGFSVVEGDEIRQDTVAIATLIIIFKNANTTLREWCGCK